MSNSSLAFKGKNAEVYEELSKQIRTQPRTIWDLGWISERFRQLEPLVSHLSFMLQVNRYESVGPRSLPDRGTRLDAIPRRRAIYELGRIVEEELAQSLLAEFGSLSRIDAATAEEIRIKVPKIDEVQADRIKDRLSRL